MTEKIFSIPLGIENFIDNNDVDKVKKYGFLTKILLGELQYLTSIGYLNFSFIISGLILGLIIVLGLQVMNQFSSPIVGFTLLAIISLLYIGIYVKTILMFTYRYTVFKKIMITESGKIIANNTIYTHIDAIPVSDFDYIELFGISKADIMDFFTHPNEFNIIVFFLVVITSPIIITLLILSYIGLFISRFIDLFLPFNQFIKYGDTIQESTSEIVSGGKAIRESFSTGIDFKNLRKQFGKLSSAFSKISILIRKLETLEQKINKGDLFDSTKYINSLRDNIHTPLLSLKDFLEKKKAELQSSQQELMKVRVTVGGEGDNRELQSIRARELMKELDENIVKLDGMLERL